MNHLEFSAESLALAEISFLHEILLALVNMLLEGPGNAEQCNNQAALSLVQLIVVNSIKRPRKRSVSETAAIKEPASVGILSRV